MLCLSSISFSVSSLHNRNPVEGFTDCPPVIELASLFGFDLKSKVVAGSDPGSCLFEQKVANFQDFVVPSGDSSVFSSSGKSRQGVYEQLVELGKRGMVRVNGDGTELGPLTPPSRCAGQRNLESLEFENGDEESLHQQTPFTSLLMLPNHVDATESDCVSDLDFLWDCSSTYQEAQVWDFQVGTSKDCSEPGPQGEGYDVKDPGFVIKNYVDFTEEGAFTTQKVMGDAHLMSRCSTTSEDNFSRNVSYSTEVKSFSNQQLSSYKPATEIGLSPESMTGEPKTCSSTAHIQVTDQPFLAWIETLNETKQMGDAELFAQNRGNAMLRYDKRIRYESRKARADTRKRVKGRFQPAGSGLAVYDGGLWPNSWEGRLELNAIIQVPGCLVLSNMLHR
ncbi:unnamed protein product [Dovyalis caffra]|uniref:CCT domain-containing protein n=1 Tax=Dovyalis caffra TaxID=77055 RepID=A0AAV1R2Z9_9ROSI|nr:unnamed protein product [Dovyalis caffra]